MYLESEKSKRQEITIEERINTSIDALITHKAKNVPSSSNLCTVFSRCPPPSELPHTPILFRIRIKELYYEKENKDHTNK